MTPGAAVPVSIIFGSGVLDPTETEEAARYVRDLCERLALPALPEISVAPTEPAGMIVVDGTKIAPPVPDAQDVSVVSTALFRNRVCLVTDDVARAVYAQFGLVGKETDFHKFHKMLRECVRAGRSISRLQSVQTEAFAADPANWLETALTAAEAPDIRILVSQHTYDQLVDPQSEAYLPVDDGNQDIGALLKMMSEGLFWELGMHFGGRLELARDLSGSAFRIGLNDISTPALQGLEAGQFLVNDTADRLNLLGMNASSTINPVNLSDASIVNANEAKRCEEELGLTTWTFAGHLILHTSSELRGNAAAFCTTDIVTFMLERLQNAFPDLIHAVRDRFDTITVTQALRALLSEEISIRNLRGLLEAMLEIQGTTTVSQREHIVFGPQVGSLLPVANGDGESDRNAEAIGEMMRAAQRAYISHKYTRGQNTLMVYLVDPEFEVFLDPATTSVASEHTEEAVLSAFRETVQESDASVVQPVVLTTTEVRKHLRLLIEHEYPRLAVLSYSELQPTMNIQPLARIS